MKKYFYLLIIMSFSLSCSSNTTPDLDKIWKEARAGEIYTNTGDNIEFSFLSNGDITIKQTDTPDNTAKFIGAKTEQEAFYRLPTKLSGLGYDTSLVEDKTYLWGIGFAVSNKNLYNFDYNTNYEQKIKEWDNMNTETGKKIKSGTDLSTLPIPNPVDIEWDNFPIESIAKKK